MGGVGEAKFDRVVASYVLDLLSDDDADAVLRAASASSSDSRSST